MHRLAVIIPAYNAERSIEGTVRSVASSLSRVKGATELIVVDDGSKDGTLRILRQLEAEARLGTSFRVVHQDNRGCYYARLAGMRAMTAEYFGFVDSDDAVEPEMFPRLIDVAESTGADVVECGWRFANVSPACSRDSSPTVWTRREEVIANYINPVLIGVGESAYVWNKIYRAQYDFSSWVDGDFGSYEDLIHNLQLFSPVRSMARIVDELYLYSPTESSVTRTFSCNMVRRYRSTARAKSQLILAHYCAWGITRNMFLWRVNELRNLAAKFVLSVLNRR